MVRATLQVQGDVYMHIHEYKLSWSYFKHYIIITCNYCLGRQCATRRTAKEGQNFQLPFQKLFFFDLSPVSFNYGLLDDLGPYIAGHIPNIVMNHVVV